MKFFYAIAPKISQGIGKTSHCVCYKAFYAQRVHVADKKYLLPQLYFTITHLFWQ